MMCSGNFADSAEFMAITHGDQFKAADHIVLNAYCPDGNDPRYNCMLDLCTYLTHPLHHPASQED